MPDKRSTELAKIHIAKAQLGMDDDTYRAMLRQVAGVDSARYLTTGDRHKVLEYLRSRGAVFERKKRHRDPGIVQAARGSLMTKLEAQLADMKLPWSYADAIVERMHGLTSLRFANGKQLRDVVAALAYEQRRRAR